MKIASMVFLGAALLLVSRVSGAQPVQVSQREGLVTIQCKDAPLSGVFERIKAETGIELTLEDEVKSKRLSANLTDLPLPMAVARLLEGIGVNYIVMMDPSDWARVDKVFVGGGGGGASHGAAGAMRAPTAQEPVEEAFEEAPPDASFDNGGAVDAGDAVDPGQGMAPNDVPPEDMAQSPDEFGTAEDSGAAGPPGSSPVPDFLPPAQSFPRSNFTPGLPRANPRAQTGATQGQQPQQQNPANTPPATFPFMDAFGRPIPIPPGMNQQQRQQQQQQQQKKQQQQQ